MEQNDLSFYKKATSLIEVDNAVRIDVPLVYGHPFYTDFSDVRGDFEDKVLYRQLNINPRTFIFDREANRGNKIILFLAGMRGSGKTSELTRIATKIHNKDAFFCVTCNLDEGLDINDLEYMDILVFQLERLFEELYNNKPIPLEPNSAIIEALEGWFGERVKEVNKVIKKEGGFEIELGALASNVLSFLGITAKLKANLSGSKENADKIRTVLKNNFSTFAQKFNQFIEEVNMLLRQYGVAKEVLFIIDGLEKMATVDVRKKIILEETNRIRQIKAHTIFTLPIELMPQKEKLRQFSTVTSFPFVKIIERNGQLVDEAITRFKEFVYRRIDKSLFDSESTVEKAILYGGGSPRELLRVLEYANLYADEDHNQITINNLDKGIKKLAADTSQYLSEEDLNKLKKLKEANEQGKRLPFDESWQDLLEKLIVLEYNDGTYKRVHPVIEESELYKQYVG